LANGKLTPRIKKTVAHGNLPCNEKSMALLLLDYKKQEMPALVQHTGPLNVTSLLVRML
jgi:hypothetical protein